LRRIIIHDGESLHEIFEWSNTIILAARTGFKVQLHCIEHLRREFLVPDVGRELKLHDGTERYSVERAIAFQFHVTPPSAYYLQYPTLEKTNPVD
jgi:hypothetical protein